MTCRKDKYVMQSESKKIVKYSVSRAFIGLSFFSFIILGSLAVSSKTANAGLISYFNSLVGGEEVSARIEPAKTENNLQNLSVLVAANNIDPNPSKPAEIIPVIDGGTLVADLAENNEIPETSTQISTYVVRPGDTISGVAKMFKVSVNTILWANDISGKSTLRAGQTLIILPVSGLAYTVQKNDTVSGIAKRYNSDPEDIYNYNDINPLSKLSIGQKIIIPNAEIGQTTIASSKIPTSALLVNTASLPSYPGYYSCPVQNARLTQKIHGRNGVDLAAPVGTPLRASAGGTIIISKSNGAWNGGYGNFVVISHENGTQSLYSHLSKATVSVGDNVLKGQTIGYIGMTGLTTGPHLHFEIRGAKNPFAGGGCN